jgi:lipoprotein-releasing system ATP-binding protein
VSESAISNAAISPAAKPITLSARGLARRYHDGQRVIEVFQGLDFDIEAGTSASIVGESGIGKSTLLHLLGALDYPDAGRVEIEGRDVFALPAQELAALRNSSVGFVFQFHHLLGDFTAEENVMLPLLVGGLSRAEARSRSLELLGRVGLGDRCTHRPGELSGGEQQRVAVARALIGRPALVLADEPTGNLDPETAEAVHGMLVEVQKEAGCALVVVTHNAQLAALADRTYRMEKESLVEITR